MRALKRALYEAKTIVAAHPRLVLPAARWRGRGVALSGETDIVIEGYPRSANTFAVAAFDLAQEHAARIAHHLHAPGHVIAAIGASVPVLVLVRDPEECVLEFVVRKPHLTLTQALRGYVRFYGPLVPYRPAFVVGPFEQVTTDFGAVIRRLNERFGTSFRGFVHTEENVRACFEAIERDYARVAPGPDLERIVARPSRLRDELKDALRTEFRTGTPADLRSAAGRLYEAFTADAPAHQ